MGYITFCLLRYKSTDNIPYTNALVNSTESLENEQSGILDEVIQTRNEEKVIYKHLKIAITQSEDSQRTLN